MIDRGSQRRLTLTIPEVWTGGYYELSMYLGPPSESRILAALQNIWHNPHIRGPYMLRHVEPDNQRIVPVDTTHDRLFGLVNIRSSELPCATFIVREENAASERCADFVSFCVPLGALSLVFPIGAYPFGDIEGAASWRAEIDAFFLEFLRSRRDGFEFELAVIGWEPELMFKDVSDFKRVEIASERSYGVALPDVDDVRWYPPTRHDLITLG